MLEHCECVLFLDGLDEIFNIEDKIDIQNSIKAFSEKFTNVKIIITSRIIGYEDIKFDPKIYKTFQILDFDDAQIEKYIRNWYCGGDVDSYEDEIEELLRLLHSSLDDELFSNPLLLSLIVLLFWNNKELPQSRLEVYESCTNTLIEKWEESKKVKIDIDKLILDSKTLIFMNLAFWQYVQVSENKEMTYKRIAGNVFETLKKLELANDNDGIRKANDFLEYAKNRSIFFDDSFTHKTFAEYYTSLYIDRKFKTENDLLNFIKKYINNSYWEIVMELVFLKKDTDAFDSEYLDFIINGILNAGINSYNFLLNIILKLKLVKKATVEKTLHNALRYVLNKTNRQSLELTDGLRAFQIRGKEKYFEIIKKTYNNFFINNFKQNSNSTLQIFSYLFYSYNRDKDFISSSMMEMYDEQYHKLQLKSKLKYNLIFRTIEHNISFVEEDFNKNTYKLFMEENDDNIFRGGQLYRNSFIQSLLFEIFRYCNLDQYNLYINRLLSIKGITELRILRMLANARARFMDMKEIINFISNSNKNISKIFALQILSNSLFHSYRIIQIGSESKVFNKIIRAVKEENSSIYSNEINTIIKMITANEDKKKVDELIKNLIKNS